MSQATNKPEFDAWNPGLEPDIPRAFARLETIYRPENVLTEYAEVAELAELTGLAPEELVVFRPDRLAVHEVLVRVSADIVVPEGEEEEDFGINFRHIAERILRRHVEPHAEAIRRAWSDLHAQVFQRVRALLADALLNPAPTPPPELSLWRRLFGRRPPPAPQPSRQERDFELIAGFKARGLTVTDPLDKAVCKSLYRVLGTIAGKRGYIGVDHELLARLVSRHVCNSYGSSMIGALIEPWIAQAIKVESFATIPNAEQPILFSLKGASAAGKSSLRPMLKDLVREHGIAPETIGTISPDVWRRFLLDYDTLGDAYKYAGRLTSQEVIVIDAKLDRYIRAKAGRDRAIPHLLVDRFRFDSFASEKISRILHHTYARYVHTMYMYFVVTPPEETVERGWRRGLERGRYKAVEDFLDHSVEAYVGMPKILFKWLANDQPVFRYVFLDNSVPKGTYPRTIARGSQKRMIIADPLALIDIERYQKINIKARAPTEVYPAPQRLTIENNLGFLRQCLQRLPEILFEWPESGTRYLRAADGRFEVLDAATFQQALAVDDLARLFRAIAPGLVTAERVEAEGVQS